MPAKKKKGKGSKLARMSEEERLRYLQHRAELELEAKRRKQELIAAFTKNKLKREEAFTRLNTAKINEQWRFLLRRIKCKELYDDVEYLWKNFDRTLRAKDAVIHKLYEELGIANIDNRRLQESHMEMIDKLIGSYTERLKSMQRSYSLSIREKETGEMEELNKLHGVVENERKYLETVIFAQSINIKSVLTKTRTRNAVNTGGIEYLKEDEISSLRQRVGDRMEDLWRQLNNVVAEYESSTSEKRKQYDYFKEQENAMQFEAAQFPRRQSNFQRNVDALKENYCKLMDERSGRIDRLNFQSRKKNDNISTLRQEIKINRTIDAIQLKRMSVMSVSVIKKLKIIEEKSSALLLLVKMCSKLESCDSSTKKYSIYRTETAEEISTACVTSPYDKMEKFWERYNYVKAGNIDDKYELDHLLLENRRLRHALRNYLMTLSRVPASRPR